MNEAFVDLSAYEGEPELRAESAIDRVQVATLGHHRKRQRGLTAREALLALQFEVMFVLVCSAKLRDGELLSEEDHARLVVSIGRVNVIVDEVTT